MRVYFGFYPLPEAEYTAVMVTDDADCLPPNLLKLTSRDLDEDTAESFAEMFQRNGFAVTYQVGDTFWELDV